MNGYVKTGIARRATTRILRSKRHEAYIYFYCDKI